jgi:ATP-dependent Lon protease
MDIILYNKVMKFFKKSEEEHHDSVLEELREKIASVCMPSPVEQIACKELELLSRISPTTTEYTIGLAYIDYLVSLPWNKRTEDNLDLTRAEEILNQEHYGLQKIKERVLEHLAVRTLKMNRKPSILVVDDEEVARKNLAHVLAKEDYMVLTAANGSEALKKLSSHEFDVILTDLKMEKVDGMEVLRRTKAVSPGTQVILITGYATVDTAVEAIKKGAFHYIAKPFKLDEVRGIVQQALDKKSLKREAKGSVLCFSGPPGTGKTSLCRTIARVLGRKFARIALGGIKDEAEIRGHRRTYAGAMPGRIIEEIRRSESVNPVMILDEVDKIGRDVKGDPSSALLEVLDPEQNAHFLDHYLGVPFDLSQVMFLITANVADNIMGPLRDRMEVIQFSGYTDEEKMHIASQFLVPRQIRETGLSGNSPRFTEDALYRIIREYTYEAGIRNLEREINAICRKIAMDFVQRHEAGNVMAVTVTPDSVEKLLGPRKHYMEVAEGADRIGVTTGLVWTEVGGDIIFVEAARMKGKQQLILTGSLGDVMRESAQTALSFLRSNAAVFNIPDNFFEGHDIHIHVPAGAIPKDGPSAGTTIALALISMLSGRAARRDVAITGELTLSGRILPVGGIREKLLAAKRARITTVILPLKNKVEAENIPDDIQRDLKIHFAGSLEGVLDLVLTP